MTDSTELVDEGACKMRNPTHRLSRGQSMVTVALLMFVFIGMLALVLDGGYAYLQRRAAQTAADAGALAGAREYCLTGDADLAIGTALEYTLDRNTALEAEVSVDADGIVTVVAHIPFTTFFGQVLGQPTITASAIAAADCFVPGSATGILPVAWNCAPPIEGFPSDSTDCELLYGKLYVIMDSKSSEEDFYCQDPTTGLPEGALDCDFDDDGYNDLLAGGDRSWLDLNGGGGGSSELVDWINGGFGGTTRIHTWYGGQTGVDNNVFHAAHGREGANVLIPVFDEYCDQPGMLPETSCPGFYHDEETDGVEDTTVPSGGASTLYYHVISFAIFHITCVDAPPYGPCWGHEAAGLPNHVKTIEGYFLTGFPPGVGGKPGTGKDAGAYSLYLIR